MQDLYDQPLIVENPGSIVIATHEEKVGLIQNFRFVGDRILPDAGNEYIKMLQKEKLWGKLIGSLGHWTWEAPRGLTPPKTDQDSDLTFNNFVLKTAKLEALEEAGLEIKNARLAGMVNINSTFFAHPQYVVRAEIESIGKNKNEDLEMIGALRLFTRQQLRELNDNGDFDDGMTLAGLALSGISI